MAAKTKTNAKQGSDPIADSLGAGTGTGTITAPLDSIPKDNTPPNLGLNDVLPQKQNSPKPQASKPPVKDSSEITPFKSVANAVEKDQEPIPERVKLIPFMPGKFRLGMENTKENYVRIPGTTYRWEPTKRGNRYLTGLKFISRKQIADLEHELGKTLDDRFYEELTYAMDGSNPNGHNMDLSGAFEKVVYLAMLESHLIANGQHERKNGKKPQAEWYIENIEAEAEADAVDRENQQKAMISYNELSDHKKKAFAKIVGINVFGLSPKAVDGLLWKWLFNEKPDVLKKNIKTFIQMVKWTDTKVAVHEEVKDAIAANILRKNGAQDWVYADQVLASTEEQVISKLLLPENQELRMTIKSKLAIR